MPYPASLPDAAVSPMQLLKQYIISTAIVGFKAFERDSGRIFTHVTDLLQRYRFADNRVVHRIHWDGLIDSEAMSNPDADELYEMGDISPDENFQQRGIQWMTS